MPSKKLSPDEAASGAGCVGFLILALLFYGVHSCNKVTEETPEQATAKMANQKEERRRGDHCLSPWDGMNADFVELVKQRLRDPGSFEHVRTIISPVDEKGEHAIVMEYRARNGLGGMVLDEAIGRIKQIDCSARVTISAVNVR